MKPCPLCAEEIQDAAVVCRHCGARQGLHGWEPGTPPGAGGPSQGAPGWQGGTTPPMPPYGAGAGYAPRRGEAAAPNGMAIASLVLSILFMCGIGSVLAVIFGVIAKRQIVESGGQQTGDGMATAGIIIGGLGVLLVLGMILFVGLFSTGTSYEIQDSEFESLRHLGVRLGL